MALEQVADIGFDARWSAWQRRSALQDRAAADRMNIVWMLLAVALVAAGVFAVFL
jgi:hypothetical protein